jgi:hypothetical protein
LCENNAVTIAHFLDPAGATISAGVHTGSIRLKAGERTSATVYLIDSVGIVSGTVTTYNLSAGTITSGSQANIISAGNGYFLCSVYGTCAAGAGAKVRVLLSDGSAYTGDGSSGIYIADAQLTPGYLPLAVTETTSAAVYGPRFDYDPSSLVAQNLLTYSNTFDNAIWVKSSAAVTPNASVSPDGTNNASLLSCITVAGGRITQVATTLTATNTFSGYAKSGNVSAITVLMYNVTTSAVVAQADVNLITGAVTNLTGTCITASLVSGWWRFALTNSSGITSGNVINCYFYAGLSSSAVGSNVYIYGAQLNQGSTALPYTATTTAPYTLTTARGLLIEEQRANLATFSNTLSDASWTALGTKNVAASAILSPEGVANAWTLTDSSAVAFDGVQKSATIAADGTTYTSSVYILKTSGSTSTTFGLNIAITGGTTVSTSVRINTDTGAVLSGTAVVTNAGLWWRVSCSVTNNSSVGNVNLAIQLYPATAAYNTATDAVAATGSATVYGAQLEAGAFATSYIPTVASTATRNADSASVNTLTPWFNAVAGTLYVSALRSAVNPTAAPNAFEIGDGTNNNRLLIYNPAGGTTSEFYVANGGVVQAQINVANGFQNNVTGKVAGAYQVNDFQQASNGTLGTADTSGTLPTVTAAYIGRNGAGAVYWNGWISSIRYYPTRLPNASLQSITA